MILGSNDKTIGYAKLTKEHDPQTSTVKTAKGMIQRSSNLTRQSSRPINLVAHYRPIFENVLEKCHRRIMTSRIQPPFKSAISSINSVNVTYPQPDPPTRSSSRADQATYSGSEDFAKKLHKKRHESARSKQATARQGQQRLQPCKNEKQGDRGMIDDRLQTAIELIGSKAQDQQRV